MPGHILTEVFLSDFEVHLNPIIGTTPTFISLLEHEQMEAFSILEQINITLEAANIHSKIPYPLYIISEFNNIHPNFLIHKCINDIPDYFATDKKKVKEEQIYGLNNIKNITYKLNNLNIESKLTMVKTKLKRTKEIYHLTNEYLTLKMIYDKITRTENE